MPFNSSFCVPSASPNVSLYIICSCMNEIDVCFSRVKSNCVLWILKKERERENRRSHMISMVITNESEAIKKKSGFPFCYYIAYSVAEHRIDSLYIKIYMCMCILTLLHQHAHTKACCAAPYFPISFTTIQAHIKYPLTHTHTHNIEWDFLVAIIYIVYTQHTVFCPLFCEISRCNSQIYNDNLSL